MKIIYQKKFLKSYARLPQYKRMQVDKALLLFGKNPLDDNLRNHKLKGFKDIVRSIDAAFDLRILFREKNNYFEVLLLDVGSHNQLY